MVWYKSRRVWGAIFATTSSVAILFIEIPYVDRIAAAFGLIAAALGATSYVKPNVPK